MSPYLDAALARVGQVGHLSTCVGVLFYQHCPGPGKPASQTFCTDLEEIFHKWIRNYTQISWVKTNLTTLILEVEHNQYNNIQSSTVLNSFTTCTTFQKECFMVRDDFVVCFTYYVLAAPPGPHTF